MHTSLLRTFAFVPALALAVACPDCNDAPGEDAGPNDPAAIAAAAKELCVAMNVGTNNVLFSALHGLTRCSVTDEWPELPAADRQAIEDACVPGVDTYDIFVTALEGDRVALDVDRARSCIEKGRAARGTVTPFAYNSGDSALSGLFDDADCEGAATPLLDDGDTCEQLWDCPDSLPCQASPPDSPTRRCLAPAAANERCGGTRVCGSGLSCVDETCLPPIAQGADCVTGNENGLRACADGSYCDAAASGVCQPRKPANAVCAAASECEDGLSCPTDTLVCTTAPAPIAEGQACDPAADACESYCSVCRPESAGGATVCRDRAAAGAYCEDTNHCRAGLDCDTATNQCVTPAAPPPLPGLGDPCGVNGASFECAEGSCVADRCVAGVENDPCDPSFPACEDGLVCEANLADPTAGLCVREPEIGQPCVDGQCPFGAFCNADGDCAAVRDAGASCGDDVECGSGTCLATSNTCAAAGASCYTSRGVFIQMLTLALVLPLVVRVRRRRRRR